MSLDYDTYVAQLANLLVIGSTETNFQTFLPGCIDYAEQRIYRELQLLATEVVDATGSIGANTRSFTLPQTNGQFVVVNGMNIMPTATTRRQMMPASRRFVDFLYPSETASASPSYPEFYAMVTDQTITVGPPADQVYTLEVLGTIRPTPLSSSNPSTILTEELPDLFMAASMVFATGYQRDFGAQSDDPKMSQSWEQQYQTLKNSADQEELKKKYNIMYSMRQNT